MTTTWHEDDSFWEDMAVALFSQQRWDDAPREVEQVIELAGVQPEASVLDLPCGPGRHALQFAQRGYNVTGVDRTARYLDEARTRAADAGLSLELIEADMREFQREGAFDLVINLYTSFGYFDEPGDDVKTARNFHSSLKPGGKLVMQMAGKEHLASQFRPRDWQELDDGSILLEERELINAWQGMRNWWILIKDGKRYEHELNLRFYGSGELVRVLQDAGFEKIDVYGGLDGRPYDQDAQRLVVVAKK